MKKLVALLIVLSLAVACTPMQRKDALTYTVNVAAISNEIPQVSQHLDDVVKITDELNLSEEEKFKLKELEASARDIITLIGNYLAIDGSSRVDDAIEKLVGLAEINEVVNQARALYYEGSDLITPHYGKLSQSNKFKLKTIQRKLINLDKSWSKLQEANESNSDVTAIMKDVLVITKAVVTVAAAL